MCGRKLLFIYDNFYEVSSFVSTVKALTSFQNTGFLRTEAGFDIESNAGSFCTYLFDMCVQLQFYFQQGTYLNYLIVTT